METNLSFMVTNRLLIDENGRTGSVTGPGGAVAGPARAIRDRAGPGRSVGTGA